MKPKKKGDPSKKPVPPTWRQWRKEVDGIKRMLDETRDIPRTDDTRWVHGMRAYNRKRLAWLKDNEPER